MVKLGRLSVVLVLLATIFHGASVQAGPLSDEALARLGKDATVLVERPAKGGTGSAFCVHPDGYFITNEHVIRGISSSGWVKLVLNAGGDAPKLFQAAVVRTDAKLDLALLRVEGKQPFAKLELGPVTGLSELTEVVAFGFPFGKVLAADQGQYPAISVNVGRVTSLRKRGGELWRIQLDAEVNPGNSGGPVLDKAGKVVGVIVAGVRGAGVNFAIPASHVERFLAMPEIEFAPPKLTRSNLHAPVAFEVRAASYVKQEHPLSLELALTAGRNADPRRFTMKLKDGLYRAKVTPVQAPKGSVALRVNVEFAGGTIRGTVPDRTVSVGKRKIQLRDLRSLQFAPKPQAIGFDGKSLAGAISGVQSVPVTVAPGLTFKVDLARAKKVILDPPPMVSAVSYTITAKLNGKLVRQVSGTMAVAGLSRTGSEVAVAPAGSAGNVEIQGVELGKERVVRRVPSSIEDVAVGGGGRYLILHLPKVRKLAVFDTNDPKHLKYISLTSDNVKFAAGMNKLIVILADKNIIQRWNLETLKRELAVTLPVEGQVQAIAMGSASAGPLLVSTNRWRGFLDIHKLKTLKIAMDRGGLGSLGNNAYVRASADGTVFGLWRRGGSPSGLQVTTLTGNKAMGRYEHKSVGYVVPGPEGRFIYTVQGVYNSELRPLNERQMRGRNYLPAHRSNYYIGFSTSTRSGGIAPQKLSNVSVYMAGDTRPLVNLNTIDVAALTGRNARRSLTLDKRMHFVPDANLIITIPATNDRLVLHRFDIMAALKKADIDYLFISSKPPSTATQGRTYRYAPVVQSKKGGVKMRLDSGPDGMELTGNGVIQWDVPQDFGEARVDVIVSVTDATGQELFHTFAIRIAP